MKHGGVSAILFMHRSWGSRRHCGHDIETGYSPSFRDDHFESVVFEYDWHKTEVRNLAMVILRPHLKIKALGINYFARQNCRCPRPEYDYYSIQSKELSVFEEVSAISSLRTCKFRVPNSPRNVAR